MDQELVAELQNRGLLKSQSDPELVAELDKRGLRDAVATPPSDPNFEVAGRSQTAQGQTPEYVADPSRLGESFPGQYSDPSAIDPSKALLTNQPISGMVNRFIRGLPANAGGMAGAAAGTASGLAVGPLAVAAGPVAAIGGAGIGAAAGESARQAIVNYMAVKNGQQPTTPGAVLGNVGMQAGANALGEGVFQVGKAFLPGTQAYFARNFAGVKAPDVSEAMIPGNAARVGRFLGVGPEVGDSLASDAKNLIGDAIQNGEQKYAQAMASAKASPIYANKTFDLSGALKDSADKISAEYGFVGSNRVAAAPGAETFKDLSRSVTDLKDASLPEVWQIQKNLNAQASAAYSSGNKPLASAVGKLQDAVKEYLGTQIPEVGQANASYSAAKQLEEQTTKVVGANDPIKFITRTMNEGQMTEAKKALLYAIDKVPGLGDVVSNIKAFQAAKGFEPPLRGVPPTGMGAAAIFGGVKAIQAGAGMLTHDPVAQAGTLALGTIGAAVASPRLALLGMRAAQNKTIGAMVNSAFHLAPGSIAAYYQLPGVATP